MQASTRLGGNSGDSVAQRKQERENEARDSKQAQAGTEQPIVDKRLDGPNRPSI